MPAISCVLNTVRATDAYREDRDVLLCVADDLAKQTFKDFELVAVDGLHPFRAETFQNSPYPFPIRHVAPRQTRMVKDQRVAISAYKNTGIMYSQGELILTLDDCCWIDDSYLQRCWDAWSREKTRLAAMVWPSNAPVFQDGRRHLLDGQGKCVGPRDGGHTPPMYGFASFSTEAALAVNGYDEMMDGSQGLEDVDMGIRLQKAGFRIGLDARHIIRTGPSSTPWDTRLFPEGGERIVKCCQSSLRIQLGRNLPRANETPWGPAEWSKLTPCGFFNAQGNPEFNEPAKKCRVHGMLCAYPDTFAIREHPGLQGLKDEPPVFNLRQLRDEALSA